MQHKNVFHNTIRFYLTSLIAFFIPLGHFVSIAILLLVLQWIIEGNWKEKIHRIVLRKSVLLPISIYILYVVGILYSANLDAGFFDIQIKLSLLLFPLIFASVWFDTNKIHTIRMSFILGCFTACIICLTKAVYGYYMHGTNNFYYMDFSVLLHPGYFSMYLNVAILILLYYISNNIIRHYNLYARILLILFSAVIVLLASKMGLITLVFILVGYCIYLMKKHRKYMLGILGVILLVVAVAMMIKQLPFIAGRLKSVEAITSMKNIDKSNGESTAVRILVWNASFALIKEHLLLGVGTGDVKDALLEKYKEKGFTGAYKHKLNAHNQFLQTFAALGLPGFLSLILGIAIPFVYAFRTGDYLYFFFLFIITANFLAESMLETQAGVMFYAFFNSLFLLHKKKDNQLVQNFNVN